METGTHAIQGGICHKCKTLFLHDPIDAEPIRDWKENGHEWTRFTLEQPQVCPECGSKSFMIDIDNCCDTVEVLERQ